MEERTMATNLTLEQMMLGMYEAMPDLRITIEDMIAEGDKVVCKNV
jgi:predicted ester cyclase